MERIESQAEPGRLLHILFRGSELDEPGVRQCSGRIDICPPEEGLQVAYLKLLNEQTFRPHKHVERRREIPRTQESWIVVRGIVQVVYYDIDNSLIGRRTLNAGDATVTFAGGHTYKSYSTGSRVYEIKTGPYVGTEADKEFIGA